MGIEYEVQFIKDFAHSLKSRQEERGSISDPNLWPTFFQNIRSKTGQTVNADTAMRLSAFYACVRVLAETVASLPLKFYLKKSDGKKEAENHALYNLLHSAPNPDQTSFEFREMKMGHLCTRGNFYAYKEVNNGGDIVAVWPLNPARMTVKKKGTVVYYEYIDEAGREVRYASEQIWHIRGLSSDGLVGLSPIDLARESLGFSLATQEFGASFYNNGARAGGILKYPGKLLEDQKKRLSDSFQEGYTKENAHRTMVLEGGLDWTQVSIDPVNAQFIETMNFTIEDMARIHRVPCFLLQHPDKTSTYASAEQSMLSFVIHTIRPWLVRIEQSITRCLLKESEKGRYFAEHRIEGLLRGDHAARAQFYKELFMLASISPNEIRELENMNPYEGGDKFYLQMQMIEANKPREDLEPKEVNPNANSKTE